MNDTKSPIRTRTDSDLAALVRRGTLNTIRLEEGLYLRVRGPASGQFYFRYTRKGKARWIFIGDCPDMKRSEASALARAYRVDLDKGLDVARERQKAMDSAYAVVTFGDAAKGWMEREIEPRYENPQVVQRVLNNDILPILGKLPIEDVTSQHIDQVLRAAVERGAPTIANDALRFMRRILAFSRRRGWVAVNLAADFSVADAGGFERPRDRALPAEEITQLFAAMAETSNLGRENELAFKLLFALCVRKRELLTATWDQFDLEGAVWHHPGGGARKGRPVAIPLPPQVVVWLRELRIFANKSTHLFPARRRQARGRGLPHISMDTLNVALGRVQHGLEHFTVHDMRRTARSHLSLLKVSREVSERALNHKVQGSEGIYNQYDFFDERRAALELWTQLLVDLENGQAENVVPLRRTRRAKAAVSN